MPINICFIRHGQTNANKMRIFQGRTNLPLNETGINQAYETSNLLKELDIKWDAIISSPLDRAFTTASIISNELNLNFKIVINDLAIERSFGEGEGVDITDENYTKFMNNEFSNQESEDDVTKRGKKLFNDLLFKYNNKNIIVVSHSHMIKGILKNFIPSLTFQDSIRNTSLNFLIFKDENDYQTILNIKETNELPSDFYI